MPPPSVHISESASYVAPSAAEVLVIPRYLYRLRRRFTFSDLYDDVIGRWPPEVGIAEASVMSEGGGTFPALTRLADEIDEQTRGESEVLHLMSWAAFCGFHRLAYERYSAGDRSVRRAEVDRGHVRSKFEESLFWEGGHYARYRDDYSAD